MKKNRREFPKWMDGLMAPVEEEPENPAKLCNACHDLPDPIDAMIVGSDPARDGEQHGDD